jgi:hypothetical protein
MMKGIVLFAFACGSHHAGPPPSCTALAPHLDDILQPDPHWHDDSPREHRVQAWTQRCEQLHYDDATRACLAAATSIDDVNPCMRAP